MWDYVRLCEIMWNYVQITCNSHNCPRRAVGVNYWKEQFKLLASYEGLRTDYVRLCAIHIIIMAGYVSRIWRRGRVRVLSIWTTVPRWGLRLSLRRKRMPPPCRKMPLRRRKLASTQALAMIFFRILRLCFCRTAYMRYMRFYSRIRLQERI